MTEITTRMGCKIKEILLVTGDWEIGDLTINAVRADDGEIRNYHISELRHPEGLKGVFAVLESFRDKQ